LGDVGRRPEYRAQLRALQLTDWAPYLRARSGLPGPRANLELAQAAADEADTERLEQLLATDEEYLLLCGVIGLGGLLEDDRNGRIDKRLRHFAADRRWRVREGVAMALQRLGDADLSRLLSLTARWAVDAHPLIQRAAVAGICEPRLLKTAEAAAVAIEACDQATRSLAARPVSDRKDEAVRWLRQALGYCWSVAVAADPAAGLPRFRALAGHDDPDVGWIMRENAKKSRLAKLL
jgi:hypothetical protein